MIEERTWQEFVDSGLMWWVNRSLHLFGWALVRVQEEDGTISRMYPARVKFRGFDEKTEEQRFKDLSKYLKDNIEELEKEANE